MQPTDLLMYALIAVMVFMMFRGSRKRKKQAEEMQAQLVPGAKVMLHSGIVGKVISVTDDHIVLESAGSKLEVVKMAVRTVSVWDAKEDDAEPVAEKAAPKIVATKTAAAKPAVKKPATKTTATKPAAKLEKN